MKKIIAIALLFVGFQANAGVIISPTGVSTNMGNSFSGNISNIIAQSGPINPWLSGVTDYNAYNPSSQQTTNNSGEQWWGAAGALGRIDFDLGGQFLVQTLALWNPNTIFGVMDFDVLISDNATFSSSTNVGSFTSNFSQNFGLEFDLVDTVGSFVRFNVTSVYGGRANLSEVAFEAAAAVPEPSIIALFALGIFGIGFANRNPAAARR
jgi:hypothetical protein